MTKELGLYAGRIAGVPLYLKQSWFVLLALLGLGYGLYLSRLGYFGSGAAFGISMTLACFIALGVLVHELGHALAGRMFRLEVKHISLTFWGGQTKLSAAAPLASCIVSLAGPVINLLYACLLYGLAQLFSASPFKLGLNLAAEINVYLTLFNMLPSYPLDGGHTLEAFLAALGAKRSKTASLTAWTGLSLVPILAGLTFYNGLWANGWALVLLLLLAWFSWRANVPVLAALYRQRHGNDPLAATRLTQAVNTFSLQASIADLRTSWDRVSPVLLLDQGKAVGWISSQRLNSLQATEPDHVLLSSLAYPLAPEEISLDMLRLDLLDYFKGYRYEQLPEELREGKFSLAWAVTAARGPGSSKEYLGLLTYQDLAEGMRYQANLG